MMNENANIEVTDARAPVRKLAMNSGRLALELIAFRQGADLQVMFYGGAPHIGAVALAQPGAGAQLSVLPGHREGPIAQEMADNLAGALNCTVSVACGIHYEDMSAQEIGMALALADALCQKLIECMRA